MITIIRNKNLILLYNQIKTKKTPSLVDTQRDSAAIKQSGGYNYNHFFTF